MPSVVGSRTVVLWLSVLVVLSNDTSSASASGRFLDVRVKIPPAVFEGGAATLLCLYDLHLHHAALEDSPHRTSSWAVGPVPLYSVRWYRGTREIYRYEPKESPPAKAFVLPGLRLDMAMCNAHQVTLVDIPKHLAGNYTCEVTADAPTFSTASASGTLKVISVGDVYEEVHTTRTPPPSPPPAAPTYSGSGRAGRFGIHDGTRFVLLLVVCRTIVGI